MALEVNVRVALPDLERILDRLTPSGLRPALEAIGEAGVSLTQEGFSESRDPYGTPWRPIRPYTRYLPGGRRRFRRSTDKPLLDTGLTRASFRWRVVGTTVEVGSPMEHLRRHQYGDEVPQRIVLPFVDRPVPQPWIREIRRALEAHVSV